MKSWKKKKIWLHSAPLEDEFFWHLSRLRKWMDICPKTKLNGTSLDRKSIFQKEYMTPRINQSLWFSVFEINLNRIMGGVLPSTSISRFFSSGLSSNFLSLNERRSFEQKSNLCSFFQRERAAFVQLRALIY